MALVVGTAGFIGSHLAEELLSKNIQVIGVDNFSSGKDEHLEKVIKNSKFHLINTNAEALELGVDRLDYIFISTHGSWKIDRLLQLSKEFKSRIVLVSSIELYDGEDRGELDWLKSTEGRLAKFATEHHLNARVVRLAAVYGPRMHFRGTDPVVRLIQAALLDQLQKLSAQAQFSTRALYIEDAIQLIVKSMFAGSTALKIFDGALPAPIQVAEIKQVLLDPLWYEKKGFAPSELPPWPTPNLGKTIKELHWQPHTHLVAALKETLSYFKDHEISVPELKREPEPIKPQIKLWVDENEKESAQGKVPSDKSKEKSRGVRWKFNWTQVWLILAMVVITYGLILPLVIFGYNVVNFPAKLHSSTQQLLAGEFDDSFRFSSEAGQSLNEMSLFLSSVNFLNQMGMGSQLMSQSTQLLEVGKLMTEANQSFATGATKLQQSLKIVTGEVRGDLTDSFSQSQLDLSTAQQKLAKAQLVLDQDPQGKFPWLTAQGIGLKELVQKENSLINRGGVVAEVLSLGLGAKEPKSYLVVVQDSSENRFGGGVIRAVSQVDFDSGQLKNVTTWDSRELDSLAKAHLEPPTQIKEDLGQTELTLKDSSSEVDFPTSAKQIAAVFATQKSKKVDGVISFDQHALARLLKVVGPVELAGFGQVSADNLSEQLLNYSSAGGNQKNFSSQLLSELLSKIFYLSHSWPQIALALGESLDHKNMLLYFNSSKLQSLASSQNWAGAVPKIAGSEEGRFNDFLSVNEANVGGNGANYFTERSYQLNSTINKEGRVSHSLKISYTNRSTSNISPAGEYRVRLRLYLPFGSKLNLLKWGETDLTKEVSSFSDYGKGGYSLLLSLPPKISGDLLVEYQVPGQVSFKDHQASYILKIVKQPGAGSDALHWKITYPLSYQLEPKGTSLAALEYSLETDLSQDRQFELKFSQ